MFGGEKSVNKSVEETMRTYNILRLDERSWGQGRRRAIPVRKKKNKPKTKNHEQYFRVSGGLGQVAEDLECQAKKLGPHSAKSRKSLKVSKLPG